MKRFLLLIPIIAFGFIPVADTVLDQWKSDPELKPATYSFTFYDLNEKKTLLEHNPQKVLPAASTQKLISTAIALKSMGSDHVFKTHLTHNGKINGDLLKGDLCIFPNNNPALANSRFGMKVDDIIAKLDVFLKEKGIKTISGGIEIVDPTYEKETLPRTWIWEDIGNYYGANPTGTFLNENVVELYFKSGEPGTPTEILKTNPNLPWLKFNNRVVSSKLNKDLAYVFSEPNSRYLTIEGTIPSNRNSFKVKASIPNPQKALAYLIQEGLKTKGYTIRGKYKVRNVAKNQTYAIADISSPPLTQIVEATNHKSINILAENLLQNSYKYSGVKDGKFKWAKNYLKLKMNVNTDGMILKDGSGLSRFNAISTQQLTQLLSNMRSNTSFYNSLPIAGESGTLKSFLINSWAKGNVKAKSGYMQGVRSYAGYLKTKTGKELAFAVIINNANCSAEATKKKIEELIDYASEL